MSSKFIAVVVVACLGSWSAPLAVAIGPATSVSSRQEAQRSGSAAQGHSCCPGLHATQSGALFVALAPIPAMPCGDRHPCCAQQRHENAPAVTAFTRLETPYLEGSLARTWTQDQTAASAMKVKTSALNPSPPSLGSTVLRI